MSLIEEKFVFRFDKREIVYWQGVSSFRPRSEPAFRPRVMLKGLKN